MELDYTLIKFQDINMKTREGAKLRGYFANQYQNEEIMHNHSGEKLIFKYPRVQYKVISNVPIICGIEEGAKLISKVGFDTDIIIINEDKIETYQKEITKAKVPFGVTKDYIEYEFLTPWIALNQRNIDNYRKSNKIEREEILKRILIGNILSMAKGLNYNVSENIYAWIDVKECEVNFKNIKMMGFRGDFRVNFNIPKYFGIGKSVSRGFGTVKKIGM